VFIFVFTMGFFFIKAFSLYLLPFIISSGISFVMYPVYSFMKKRFSFKPSFSATVVTLFLFLVIILIFVYVCYLIIKESYILYINNKSFFSYYFDKISLESFVDDFDLYSKIFKELSGTAFSVFSIIPLSITLILVSFVSTVFLLNNLVIIRDKICSKLNSKNAEMLNNLVNQAATVIRKFIKSYAILYVLTFIESIFIFSLIELDYILVFAFLATISDILPILGPGTVYLPISIIKFISGDYLSGITLLIFWGIVVIIRQIIEPKILSDSIKIHPLLVFIAVYFSVVSSNLWVLIYLISLASISSYTLGSFNKN